MDQSIEACSGIGKNVPVSYSKAIGCYSSFKMEGTAPVWIGAGLKQAASAYVYGDITEAPRGDWTGDRVDIKRDIDDLSSRRYPHEWVYHATMSKYFNGLGDGHYTYTSGCYSQFQFVMPMPLLIKEGEVQVLDAFEVGRKLGKFYSEQGIHLSRFGGATILAIEGKPPLGYLAEYAAKYVGTSKDPNTRLHLTLARHIYREGRWGISYGAFFSTRIPPESASLNFTMRIEGRDFNYSIPYAAISSNQFHNNETFMKQCHGKEQRLDEREIHHILTPENPSYVEQVNQPNISGKYINFYHMKNDFATITISTFKPSNIKAWVNEIITWFSIASKSNLEGLIVDVSDATGDNFCLAYQLLDFLFPEDENTIVSDILYSSLTIPAFDPARFLPAKWQRYPPIRGQVSPIAHTRGKKLGNYTTLLIDNCQDHKEKHPGFSISPLMSWKTVHLVTNSACFEACGIFATALREIHSAKTYIQQLHPGPSPLPPTIASMPSANVVNANHLNGITFPVPILHTLPIREFYSTERGKLSPLMFTPSRGSKLFPVDKLSSIDPYKVWESIIDSTAMKP